MSLPRPAETVTLDRPATREEALAQAAEAYGIESEYEDIWAKTHQTTPETQEAILAALGVPCGSAEEIFAALDTRLWDRWNSLLDPTVVISHSRLELPLRLPVSSLPTDARVDVLLESGESLSSLVPARAGSARKRALLRGTEFAEVLLSLPKLPLGYHEVQVRAAGQECKARLIVCPDKAYQPPALTAKHKAAGVGIALYGLRSKRNWGAGDFTDLERFLDWAAHAVDASFVALNPLHAIANRSPYNTSPYLPACSLYRNFLYLDIERIPEFLRSSAAQRFREHPAIQAEIDALRATELVQYERVARIKLFFLTLLYRQFRRESRHGSVRGREFAQYRDREGDVLRRWGIYSALDEWIHRRHPNVWIWGDWPEGYRDPQSAETAEFAQRHARRVEFYAWIQWLIDEQLAVAQAHARSLGMPIGLYHDLALATDQYGADLWAYREFYVPGCRVGSPPDDFSPNGQDWSFPPPNTKRHQEDGYRFFADTIRKNASHGGALRIDHVMRFFRLYWIPGTATAKQGAYVRDQAEDLMRILALESHRGQFLVVGEDLGTVPPLLREMLTQFGVFSYKLFYFERVAGQFRQPREYPQQALVSSTTHDLATLAGFWSCRDIEARKTAGLIDEAVYREQMESRRADKQAMLVALHTAGLLPAWVSRDVKDLPELTGELHNAVIGFLAQCGSALLLINQEDITKETEQQNLPGSTEQYPNWRRKMRYTLEELDHAPVVKGSAAMVKTWLARTGRGR